MSKLTSKQQRFCREYLVDLNGTQAAIRAGYSRRTAKQIATENLSKPAIRNWIDEHKRRRAVRTEITVDKVLTDIEDARSRAKDAGNFPAELKAMELQGRHLAMFVDRKELNLQGDLDVNVVINKSYDKKEDAKSND